jgi:hypothetical protein
MQDFSRREHFIERSSFTASVASLLHLHLHRTTRKRVRTVGESYSDEPAIPEFEFATQLLCTAHLEHPRRVPAGPLDTKRLYSSANARVRDRTLIR